MATNAARYRMVAGKHIKLLEFGLRRAQGPDGGLSASKYSYIGEFNNNYLILYDFVIFNNLIAACTYIIYYKLYQIRGQKLSYFRLNISFGITFS